MTRALFVFFLCTFISSKASADLIEEFLIELTVEVIAEKVDEGLDKINEDLNEIKTDVKTLKASPLKAALSALNDARTIKNESEKIDTIRSAKKFLLEAIHLEDDTNQIALAHYTLGHVYLLLKEKDSAKSHFKEVLQVKNSYKNDGYWNSKRIYDQATSTLKREASAILCAFNLNESGGTEDGLKVQTQSENWCAIYLGYRDQVDDSVKDIEQCIRKKDQLKCEDLGKKLLISYIDKNKKSSSEAIEPLSLSPDFEVQHQKDVLIASSVLIDTCSKIHDYDKHAFVGCYWMTRSLFQRDDKPKTLKNDYELCKLWIKSEKDNKDFYADKDIAKLAAHSCRAIYSTPLWPMTTEGMRLEVVQTLCTRGDLTACDQLFKKTDFYDPSVRASALYLVSSCLDNKNDSACKVIEKNRSSVPGRTYQLKLNRLEIGLAKDGALWDIRGDQNPDVRVIISIGEFNIYMYDLKIKEIRTEASGNPNMYVIDLKPEYSLYVDSLYIKDPKIDVKIYDVDPGFDDIIGEQEVINFNFTKRFNSVMHFDVSVVTQ